MVNRGFYLFFLLVLSTLFFVQSSSAAIQIKLERNSIARNETVRLHVISDQNTPATQPDFSVLDQNFYRLGTSSVLNRQTINGRQSSNVQWTIEIKPRSEGILTIPSIQVGADKTKPMVLKVIAIKKGSTQDSQLFIEIEVDNSSPYVQAQVLLTVRLVFAINLLQGHLNDPDIKNAIVQRIGEDTQYNSVRNQKTFRVIERIYAIFPQRNGAIEIPPLVFKGYSRSNNNRSNSTFDPFNMLNSRQQVRSISRPLTLTVRPPAPTFTGSVWLPANQFKLTEEWPPTDSFKVGEPFTRNIKIQAIGLSAEQLPDIKLEIPINIKDYPDKAQTSWTTNDKKIVAIKVQPIALVPTASGTQILPALKVHWWNTVLDQEEVAVLPARTLTVAPAAATVAESKQARDDFSNLMLTSNTAKNSEIKQSSIASPVTKLRWLWPLLSIIFLALWLITLLLYYRKFKQKFIPGVKNNKQEIGKQAVQYWWQKLTKACIGNDATCARNALLNWALTSGLCKSPFTLRDIAQLIGDHEISAAINQLDQSLYGANKNIWSGHQLHQMWIKKMRKYKIEKVAEPECFLPPLYAKKRITI